MNDMILILNNSDEFSMEIARRLRTEQVCARIEDAAVTAECVAALAPKGIILAGGTEGCEKKFDEQIAGLGIPVLALGRASHALLAMMGGACADAAIRERKAPIAYGKSELFAGLSDGERYLEEAHTLMLPVDVQESANACGCTIAFEETEKKLYGVQFEPERNDPEGSIILTNFVTGICGCAAWWTDEAALESATQALERAAQAGGYAICAVSGGVDSTLAAMLAHRAFGERMKAVFVDTGLMREGEADTIEASFEALGVPLLRVDRSGEVLEGLKHKISAKDKHEVVAQCLYREMLRQSASIGGSCTLVLGTNYSDCLSEGSSAAQWSESGMTVVEPLTALLKEEVRAIALNLGVSAEIANRKPFPALGLGARIIGEITGERLQAMRTAEGIFREELCQAGLERKLYKHFPVLIGAETAFGSDLVILRAVTLSGSQLIPARLPHDLVERTVQRIMTTLPGVSRVLYDQTPTQIGKESFV